MFTEKQLTLNIIKNVGLALAGIAAAVIIISIIGRQISSISSALHQKAKLTKVLENRNSDLLALEQKVAPLGSADVQIKNALPPSDDILGFVSAMESVAAEYGLKHSLRFSTPVPVPASAGTQLPLSSIDYTLTLNGHINILINYLKKFEKLPFFTHITSIDFTAGPAGWETESAVTIQAKLYLRDK